MVLNFDFYASLPCHFRLDDENGDVPLVFTIDVFFFLKDTLMIISQIKYNK